MSEPAAQKKRFPLLSYNPLSAAGAALALVTGLTLAVLLAMGAVAHEDHPYFGIFLYGVLPPFLVLGLLLIPLGMGLRWRRYKRTGEIPASRWPRIDLNDSRHRNAFFVFVLGTVVVAAMMTVGSYGAYHYSESVEFCGTTCHTVMEPEYVTYQNSSHARVACVECHVGSGADWYVKAKANGLHQVYSVARGTYPRPIETPIAGLRPAQQTCETCHWPAKVYGAQQRVMNHYKYDEANTHWPINMLLLVGGGDPKSGESGIHWHMNVGVEVDYVARDFERQDIPWVQVRERATGRVTVYEDTEEPLTEQERAMLATRRMDCMDCHNRPAHTFRSADAAIDDALRRGDVDPALPGIKTVATQALAGEYADVDEAMRQIAAHITSHYQGADPAAAPPPAMIERAVAGTQQAYRNNFFPLMKADWRAYPSNAGHFTSPGCMRCHDGKHVAPDGRAITADCNACHLILAQGPQTETLVAAGLPFEHPEDIGGMELEAPCHECHTGGPMIE
jgi:nitrate/TMAO reductase-like tetraheme cytochrome c subunit